MTQKKVAEIYIDPAYKAYYEDRLFDENDPILNRDDTLAPYIRLREALERKGVSLYTADHLLSQNKTNKICDYYSFGVLKNYRQLALRDKVRLRAFAIFEPPVVAPHLYEELPQLTKAFERVYVHNIKGDGYSLEGVDRSRLCKLYWPQPRADVIETFWHRQNRQRRIVVINGNHKPVSFDGELYSKRIEAMVELAKFDIIDLYGRRWKSWRSRALLWMPYWRNRKTLLSIYKGACVSKFEVMSNYTFALCFENMIMQGYVTEKIFDCFYAGVIPLYLGAQDITDLIPSDAYIDCRQFTSWTQMLNHVQDMSAEEIQSMRESGRSFLQSSQGRRYFNSLNEIVVTEPIAKL